MLNYYWETVNAWRQWQALMQSIFLNANPPAARFQVVFAAAYARNAAPRRLPGAAPRMHLRLVLSNAPLAAPPPAP